MPVTLVTWIAAPEWLSLAETSHLSGHDADLLRDMAQRGELEARGTGDNLVIEKTDLRDFQETLLEVLQGKWG